jgi:hypothetical protein
MPQPGFVIQWKKEFIVDYKSKTAMVKTTLTKFILLCIEAKNNKR